MRPTASEERLPYSMALPAALPQPLAPVRCGDCTNMRRRRSAASVVIVGVLVAACMTAAASFCCGLERRRAAPLRHRVQLQTSKNLRELAKLVGVDATQRDQALVSDVTKAVQALVMELNGALVQAREGNGKNEELAKLQSELAKANAALEKAEEKAEGCETPDVDVLAALEEAKAKASKAQARAFQAEMKAASSASKPSAGAGAPVSPAEWNATQTKLEVLENQTPELLERIAKLERYLERAKTRQQIASTGLREVAAKLGTGGLGGLGMVVMDDKAVADDAKTKVDLLQKGR